MRTSIFFITLLSITTTALADDTATKAEVRYNKVTTIDMGELEVDAPLVKPSIASIGEANRPVFAPMIHLRTDFKKEMKESIIEMQ